METTVKVQVNVYVPKDIDEYIELIKKDCNLDKSKFVWMMAAYVRKFWTFEDIKKLGSEMFIFGEDGLKEVSSGG
jgi:hypothetical protein